MELESLRRQVDSLAGQLAAAERAAAAQVAAARAAGPATDAQAAEATAAAWRERAALLEDLLARQGRKTKAELYAEAEAALAAQREGSPQVQAEVAADWRLKEVVLRTALRLTRKELPMLAAARAHARATGLARERLDEADVAGGSSAAGPLMARQPQQQRHSLQSGPVQKGGWGAQAKENGDPAIALRASYPTEGAQQQQVRRVFQQAWGVFR